MSLRSHNSYRESGAQWLAKLPSSWQEKRLRHVVRIQKRIAGELGHQVLSITQKGIRIKDTESNEGQLSQDYSKYQLVEPGDYAMNHMDLLTGYIDQAQVYGVTSPDYRVFTLREGEQVNEKYLLRVLQNAYLQRIFYAYGQGSSQLGRWRLPTDGFLDFVIPVPPLDEQVAIASFLDRETAKIDALIAEQKRLIELLQEKRQAVISHAVTKGLNPNAPMKDSGVEWLGEVPEHWEIIRLKRVALKRCDGPFGSGLKSEHYVENGIFVVRLQNIKEAGLDSSSKAFIDNDYYRQELGDHDVEAGDLLIAGLGDENNPVGRACVAPAEIEPAMVKADCFRYRLDASLVNPGFAAFSLNTSARYHGGKMSSGSTRARIPFSQMSEREIALPSLEEQTLIVEKLVTEMSAMDSLYRSANDTVVLLHERRSALISAAVTGQIDVRGLVTEPEEQ